VSAHILEIPDIRSEVTLVVEVMNVKRRVLPGAPEVRDVKAASVAEKTSTAAMLGCCFSAWQTDQMAKNVGRFRLKVESIHTIY
jgi:hypothetical protein